MNAIKQLGLSITYNTWDKDSDIPLFINNNFKIQSCIINGIECLCLVPYGELPNLNALRKQMEYIQAVDDKPIFLLLDSISTFRRDNLIENNISFILKDQMVFLPFMATILTNKKANYIKINSN